MKPRIAITQGDTNGIGYEIIFKTFAEPEMLELCTPIVYGSPKAAAYHRNLVAPEAQYTIINSAAEARDGRVNLLATSAEEPKIELGTPTPEAGAEALAALEKAMQDYKDGLYDALVTAPINKSDIQGQDFHFPGHTEYLAERTGGDKPLMILAAGSLRVALATTHLAIKDVAEAITTPGIVEKATILHQSLKRDFGISSPRIAILALNPHAGDNGLLGEEEADTIAPAIDRLEEAGIQAFGPYAADGFFGSGAYRHFDAILAMYHDQGLAPFKALAASEGVNITAGLPIVRTSPDHGTAYDIAGKGQADCQSMRQAVYEAIDICRRRRDYDTAHQNPLPKIYHEKRDESEKNRFSKASK